MRAAKGYRSSGLSLVVFVVVVTAMILALCVSNSMAAIEKCKVIVYKGWDYRGDSREFTSDVARMPSGWDGEISSFKVLGNARVVMYDSWDYWNVFSFFPWKGYTSNVSFLSSPNNDKISSLKIFCPQSAVNKTVLAFGDLYNGDRVGASVFNNGIQRSLILSNTQTDPGRTLKWEIVGKPNYATFTSPAATTGSVGPGAKTTFTVRLSPTEMTPPAFVINTSSAYHAIKLTATVHDTPTLSYVAPALGSNDKVNMAVGETLTFEVGDAHPSFPNATIRGYQWQEQLKTNPPVPSDWSTKSTDRTWDGSFTTAGARTIYARMIDSNDVATAPVSILVHVWEKPVVAATPPAPTPGSWLNGKYVGVVNKPITLQATSDQLPTLSAADLTTDSKVGSGARVFVGGNDHITTPSEFPSSKSVTVTFWMKSSDSANDGTPISYAVLDNDNEFIIYNYKDFNIFVNGENTGGTGVFANDGAWHFIAVTWESATGDVIIYKDDDTPVVRSIAKGAVIDNGGVLVLGQEQDSMGGGFQTAQAFIGKMDDVGVFNRALSATEIAGLRDQGLTGREDDLLYFNTFDFDGPGTHKVSRYLWYDDSSLTNLVATQLPGQTADVTFSNQNANGKIYCVAVTNHGIRSDDLPFDLRIYPTLMAEAGNPYTGRPNEAVMLKGLVNSSGYSSASFSYEWKVDTNGDDTADRALPASSDPEAEYTWSVDGVYAVELTVTATTQEGLMATATDTSTVTVEAGVPTALPGGPYRGGIAGGNFSPIQLGGNPPDFEESADVGLIDTWQWTSGPKENGLTLDGNGDYVSTGNLPITDTITVMAWIQPNEVVDRHAIAGQKGVYSFRVQGKNLFFTTPGIKDHPSPVNAQLVIGQWRHVAAVFVAEGDLEFYLDGELLSTVGASAMNASSEPTLIGNNQWDQFLNGSIDDVAIFDRALSQGEIQTIMDNSPAGNEVGLLGYWGFEEGGGTTTADLSHNKNDGTLVGDPQFFATIAENGIHNPTREYPVAGEYNIGLRVKSTAGKWSALATTPITVIDGKIEGRVRAADLRTPVETVVIKLTSSHVDPNALARVATNDTNVNTTADGDLITETDAEGKYSFSNLPLGSYTLEASKGLGDDAHEFETRKQVTELTLNAPNQLAIDYTDLSVFPVGGQIYYSTLKEGKKVLVEDVTILAQPISSASDVEALESTKSLKSNMNYSLPLFAGQYLFKAKRIGHEVLLVGTDPADESTVGPPHADYDATSGLVTIKGSLTDLDFVDYTTRTITVIVEDSGANPIETYQDNTIEVSIIGANGQAAGPVELKVLNPDDKTTFTAIVPPGKYTIALPNVPTAFLKGDNSQKTPELDVISGDGSITMVVPVKIQLSIGPAPRLFGVDADFLADLELTTDDSPEGYMFYYAPQRQTHTYVITATANNQRVADFTLEVADNISQVTGAPAPTVTYSVTVDEYTTTGSEANNDFAGHYMVTAGIPNASVVDEDNSDTYVETIFNSAMRKVPRVLPKNISFRASKNGYEASDTTNLEVIVLGDASEGSVSELVAVPTVNYLVLHDPPGDGSYSYFDESMTVKGLINGVTTRLKDGTEIPVYPSPWSDEDGRTGTGLLGYRDADSAGVDFIWHAALEAAAGAVVVLSGPVGYGLQFVNMAISVPIITAGGQVQYEVSAGRMLRTPVEGEIGDLPDLMGPGKGDIYYGEGWTLGLQTKYRLGIKQKGAEWIPDTALILTYDILERNNQYVYTATDIERIITDLDDQIIALGTPAPESNEKKELTRLEGARDTWMDLLRRNPAYQWRKEYVEGKTLFSNAASGKTPSRAELEKFMKDKFSDQNGELLIFTGGTTFEYSRTVNETDVVELSTDVYVGTESWFNQELRASTGFVQFGNGITIKFGAGSQATAGTQQTLTKSRESGTVSEQTVGFVLADGDVWDSYSTYVYEGPWGTPIFFTDPGSVTSWPWEQGTVKGVDVKMELLSVEDNGPFDYRDGAHYQFKVTSTGKGVKEGSGFNFILYDPPMANPRGATVKFNGSHEAPYTFELFKGFSGADLISGVEQNDGISVAVANVNVSIYPPEKDWDNVAGVEYPVVVHTESAGDYQIAVNKILRPRFADLRSPRATVTSPYDGQRISPVVFHATKPFQIKAFSDDEDVALVQVMIRTKQPDGVFEPWRNLSGMIWEDGGANTNVTVVTHSQRDPQRKEFTFSLPEPEISKLGVGEYQLCAIAQDAATRLSTDALSQVDAPNVDLDPPVVMFRVDSSQPSVLTTVPFYQDKESDRTYHGELSVDFTDDMTADDFSDRTFSVIDLLNNSSKVAGFVSYSPTLRKAVFVPVTPFISNGFYRATVKTDTFDSEGVVIEAGVHDLAGNWLDIEFSWTFRTTDTPFEEIWSIALSVIDTDDGSADMGKIASVAFGAEDGEDEKDARSVPLMDTHIGLSFLDSDKNEFSRDTRPADGRLEHHWFLAIDNATDGNTIQIRWLPSLKLTRSARQYQVINLVEFSSTGTVIQTIPLNPENIDPFGNPVLAYEYTATADSKYFRLDVMKANIVATTLIAGKSGWNFFSAPITPQRADPFVNLGDDIDPFQMFQYFASENTYKAYPFDLGEVSLQTGYGYFTRLTQDVEVDVGGSSNNTDVTIMLANAGWHAIGNPFIKPVTASTLKFDNLSDQEDPRLFSAAVSNLDVENSLWRWNVDLDGDSYTDVTINGTLTPWNGYFIKTLRDNIELTIPAPPGLATFQAILPPSFTPPILAPPIVRMPKPGEFELRFALTSSSSADLTTSLGTREKASVGYDGFDQSEPPRLQGTASLYFQHDDWDAKDGLYNSDIKPTLAVGETASWTVVAFTDEPGAKMRLVWEDAIGEVPDDILMEFREADGDEAWRDMRSEKSVQIGPGARRARTLYEIRATRFALEPISGLRVVAGEAEVKLQWNASENPYVTDYTIYRNSKARYELSSSKRSFIDTDVEEDAIYVYQVGVRFRTGAELRSELFTVTIMPVIKRTVLMQSYPNPFNPETWIPYELADDANVMIEIYNVTGQLVRRLSLGHQPRGRYISREKAAYWDGRNAWGEKSASGVYFYSFSAGNYAAARKMVILQ